MARHTGSADRLAELHRGFTLWLEPDRRKESIMSSPFARSFALAVLGVSVAFVPSSLRAQSSAAGASDSGVVRMAEVTPAAPVNDVDSLAVAGPRLVRVAASAPLAIRSGPALPQNSDAQVGAGANVAMMGVGVAGIIVGSLIGGDSGTVIAVGGGIIGLFGLYRYLR
jgi:hypothetical protein